ncbi:MAG: hypothetical protein Kow006_05770 [Gammaproteobacteria bacterium]
MVKTNRYLLGAAIAGLALASAPGHATNGYFAHGYGTKNNGMAGAGVALPQDAMAAATNPAGMVWVGDRMDLGVALFSPHREYSATAITGGLGANGGTSGSNVSSDNEYFLIPHYGRNWASGGSSSFGLSVYGNGGMNTEYKAADTPFGLGTFQGGDTGVDLMQLFVAPTWAKKTSDSFSWGISPILAYQRFSAKGLNPFATLSTDSGNLSNRGADSSFGYGARIGMLSQLSPTVTFGASYQSRIYMDEFDKYKGLFAEQGDFDIPASATVGFAWKTSNVSTLAVDLQWIGYGDIASIANPISPAINNCMGGQASYCLGGDNGMGFGWDDMTVLKIGYQWETSPQMTWRVGYSHGDQPIPTTEVLFNILAPGVIEDHITFGFTRQTGPGSEFNFAFMYALEEKVTGVNNLGAPSGQTIELKMDQWQLEASWGWTF